MLLLAAARRCSQLFCLDVFLALALLFSLVPFESKVPSLCLALLCVTPISIAFPRNLVPIHHTHCLPFLFFVRADRSPLLFCLLVFFPPRLRWESVFRHVLGGRSRRLNPAYGRLPEAPEDGEHLAAE